MFRITSERYRFIGNNCYSSQTTGGPTLIMCTFITGTMIDYCGSFKEIEGATF
jgi:hypothetical protein